jgi:hypothetical protein
MPARPVMRTGPATARPRRSAARKSSPSTSARRCSRLAGAPLLDQLAFVPDGEADVGPRQRMAAHRLEAVRQLGGVGLEELAARRRAEEQLLHFDVVPVARAAGRNSPLRASSRKALAWPGAARQQAQLGHRGDGGQRLAAKAHGGDRFQVLQRADLAGGVAAQRQRQFLAGDAAPSSSTEIRRTPPASSRTVTWVAPASSALSTSSRTTEAGRSTTSPAAIWLTSSSGSSRIGRRGQGMEHGIHGSRF